LQRLAGCAPVFNARYLDFSRHWGFDIAACAPGRGNEKGRVENAVGYIKKNFLAGLELSEFSAINPAAQIWLDTVANVRIHGETRRRPIDVFQEEQPRLRPLNPTPYDIGRIETARAGKQFRVTLDTNHYSVPARYVGVRVTLKAYPDRVCIYHQDQLIARHVRCYDRHQDIEDPDHPKALIAQRANAREQRLWLRFLSLSPKAQTYYDGLEQRRANARHHLRKIVALSDIYGTEPVARAIEDALVFHAFSCEYIANLLEMRARERPAASPLHLTRRQDLLEIDIDPPDLSPYERNDHES
jgi:hypothetical protein